MANVVYPPVDFFHGPSNHAPSRFGFGFGLPGNASALGAGKQSPLTPGHTQPAAFQQLTCHMNLPSPAPRVQKRRLESEDDGESGRHAVRDVTMERSPTPERPKRGAPKRAKVVSYGDGKEEQLGKGDKTRDVENDVDVGVLLASLPAQSLLPLLNAMISAQPSLKTLILPLIPRPTLETALQAIEQSARKLREAYPYSSTPTYSSASATTSLGFGFGIGGQRSAFANADEGVRADGLADGGQMRESYVLSRLRPHMHDFVSTCMSYVPYFSCVSATEGTARLQVPHKERSHPSETFLFLSALTGHITSQAPVTQRSLGRLLLPRLAEEWVGWIERIDGAVNREGGMFGGETVRMWEKTLDEFAEGKGPEGWGVMREVRDRWVASVGWLVGRNAVY